jgi:hypothetical protein
MILLRRVRAAFFFAAALPFLAQAQQKRPLTQADWDRWEAIASPTLSADGKWAAYTLNPRVGDGQFVVRSTSASTEYRTNLGYTNRENNTPGFERGRGGGAGGPPGGGGRGGRGGGGGANGAGPFSADGKFAFTMVTTAPKSVVDSTEAAQRAAGAGRGGRGGRGGAPTAARQAAALVVARRQLLAAPSATRSSCATSTPRRTRPSVTFRSTPSTTARRSSPMSSARAATRRRTASISAISRPEPRAP